MTPDASQAPPEPVERWMSPQPVTVRPDDDLVHVLRLLERYPFRHLPVVDGNRLVGMLSDRDVCLAGGFADASGGGARALSELAEIRVESIQSEAVETIGPDETVETAARRMLEKRIGALPVVDGGQCVGVITTTDLMRRLRDCCQRTEAVDREHPPRVGEHVCRELVDCRPDQTMGEAVRLAYAQGVRHLPVRADGKLVGVLSDRDLRRAMASEALAEAEAERDGKPAPAGRHVSDDMSREVLTLAPDATLSSAAHLLAENRIGAIPIVEDDELVGIVTEADLLSALLHVCDGRRGEG